MRGTRTESSIERAWCTKLKGRGWLVLKLTAYAGLPDRLFLKHDKIMFIEFKRDCGKLSLVQEAMHNKLKALGFSVEVINSMEGINDKKWN